MITSTGLTISQLKSIILELWLNKTDKLSDVSDDSVLSGAAYGGAKVGQKAIKDIAIVESNIFPEYATGSYLDTAGARFGGVERRGAIGSSTYVKIVAATGTEYLAGVNFFVNQNGIQFELTEDVTVDAFGYTYAKVRSVDVGSKTNVNPASIITVTPQPVGHIATVNEYASVGGLDAEDDEVFRLRVKNNMNLRSASTMEYINQLFQSYDDRVLRVLNMGVSELGRRTIAIVTQNGVDLTGGELSDLLDATKERFPISDLNRFGDILGIELVNVPYYEVGGANGIDFRVGIDPSADFDEVRRNIQVGMSKYFDFRYWDSSRKVEWDDLLAIVKGTSRVRYVPDAYFHPNVDEVVPVNQLPRVKKFIMRDLDGNIIYDSGGALSPVFYPNT